MSRDPIPWFRVDLPDEAASAVAAAVAERRITFGARTRALEERLARRLGVEHVVATNSGASALACALMAHGVGPGDEVIVPAHTFVATANAPRLLGADVRVVDVRADRPVMDPDAVEGALTERTRAVIVVHPNGRAADVAEIRARVVGRGVAVIEDAAQALFSRSRDRFLGTGASAGCFSTSITKLLPTGEGGFVATDSDEVAEGVRRARNNGALSLADRDFERPGFNLRPTDILSSLGLSLLEDIDARAQRLRDVWRRYAEGLATIDGLSLIDVDVDAGELPLWVEAEHDAPDELIAGLAPAGIEARSFGPALCDIPWLSEQPPCPNARRWASRGLILPSGPDQPTADVDRVIEAIRAIG